MATTTPRAEARLAVGTIGLSLALILTAPPARAQDAARMEAIERQIRSLQSELGRMRREMQARESETRLAKRDAAQARAEAQAAQRRVDTTQRQVETAQRQPEAAPRLTAQPPADQVRFGLPNNRPTITSADGRFSAYLGAQFQYDIGGALQGDRPAGAPKLNSFGENLRRGRLFFGFKYDDLLLSVTPDFGGSPDGSPTLYEANLTWTPVKPLALTFGYYKPYYGLADSMSSNDFLFLERPSIMEISRNIVAGDSRASVGGRWAADRWFAAGYFTGDSYGSNNTQATSGQTGFVGRVAGRPYADADTDLHLGFTGSYAFDLRRQSDGQALRLRDRPEWRAGDPSTRLIDTGSISADHAGTWGPEAGLRWRNFMLQGEYQRISLEQAQARGALRPDLTFDGGYVEASSGDDRRAATLQHRCGRLRPAQPGACLRLPWWRLGRLGANGALQRRRPERQGHPRPGADRDRRRLWRAAGGGRARPVLVPHGLSALHVRLEHRQREPAERRRHAADRRPLSYPRAADADGLLMDPGPDQPRSGKPREAWGEADAPPAHSSRTSPPTKLSPAPQAAQKASIGGTRPGANASLSSSATRAVITTRALPISAQAMRCMSPVLRRSGGIRAGAKRPACPLNTQGWARRGRRWGNSVARAIRTRCAALEQPDAPAPKRQPVRGPGRAEAAPGADCAAAMDAGGCRQR
ncbi:porin [Dankookia sp. P2]|uniref:porin n=1 Tax=Dankookia sp. P2 TaxID=3423955 RepID=UPI003D6748DD